MQNTNTSKEVPIMINSRESQKFVSIIFSFWSIWKNIWLAFRYNKKFLACIYFGELASIFIRISINLIFWKLSTFGYEHFLFSFFFCDYLISWNVRKFMKFDKVIACKKNPPQDTEHKRIKKLLKWIKVISGKLLV